MAEQIKETPIWYINKYVAYIVLIINLLIILSAIIPPHIGFIIVAVMLLGGLGGYSQVNVLASIFSVIWLIFSAYLINKFIFKFTANIIPILMLVLLGFLFVIKLITGT